MVKASLTAGQMQALDKMAITKIGIPSLVLMENAGRQTAEAVRAYTKRKTRPAVGIVCGLGNNAGDGFVTARHLLDSGVRLTVFLIGTAEQLKADAKANYKILKKLGVSVRLIKGPQDITLRDFADLDVIVDAIFGVGLNRTVAEPFNAIIKRINFAKKYVISVDVPSGIDATTGEALGVCVKASRTVTFTAAKKGLLKKDGAKAAGYIEVADIGIPRFLINKV